MQKIMFEMHKLDSFIDILQYLLRLFLLWP